MKTATKLNRLSTKIETITFYKEQLLAIYIRPTYEMNKMGVIKRNKALAKIMREIIDCERWLEEQERNELHLPQQNMASMRDSELW